MNKERLTAFTDGVVAVIITIMVLEMKAPEGASLAALWKVAPAFGSYVLSFIYVGIYWNNHHHLLQAVRSINGRILWANLNLLFWLSLTPFCTAWMGGNEFQPVPVALYGLVLFLTGTAYYILELQLIALHGKDSALAKALGIDRKGIASSALYILSVPLAFVSPWISCAIFVFVAAMWFVPDRRIERLQAQSAAED